MPPTASTAGTLPLTLQSRPGTMLLSPTDSRICEGVRACGGAGTAGATAAAVVAAGSVETVDRASETGV